jgi:hypothetical protein
VAAIALVAQGCDVEIGHATQAPIRQVEVVGVVASVETAVVGTGGVDNYTFDDGRTFTWDINLGGRQAQVGDLLIAGSKPTQWMMSATHEDPESGWPVGCYSIRKNGHEYATTVVLDNGTTFPKAPDFNPAGAPGEGGRIWNGAICLDREGHVTSIQTR